MLAAMLVVGSILSVSGVVLLAVARSDAKPFNLTVAGCFLFAVGVLIAARALVERHFG